MQQPVHFPLVSVAKIYNVIKYNFYTVYLKHELLEVDFDKEDKLTIIM